MLKKRVTIYTLLLSGLVVILIIVNLMTGGQLLIWVKDVASSRTTPPYPVVNLEVFPGNPLKMYLNPDCQVMTPDIMKDKIWEAHETHWIIQNIREGDIVLDIGANVGYYTLIAAKLVGEKGRVYAFEPEPVNFEILGQNVKLHGFQNVVLEQKAVSDENGSIKLYLDELNKGHHRIYQTEQNRSSIDVEAVTLDDYFSNYTGKIDFVKIDTEGAEVVILKGMEKILNENENIRMAVEFWPVGLNGFGAKGEELLSILQSHDFILFDMGSSFPDGFIPEIIERDAADLLKEYNLESGRFTNLFVVKGKEKFELMKKTLALKAEALQSDTSEQGEAHTEYNKILKKIQDFKAQSTVRK